MRPLTLGLLVSLAAAAGMRAQAPAAPRAESIRGQAIDARDSVPLRRARVIVSAGGRQLEAIFTDDAGRFVIANAPATPLTVRATKAGYAAAVITVPAGRAGTMVSFALARSAAVTGRVFNEDGMPLGTASVTARLILPGGDPTAAASSRFFTQTDRLGEYRLGSLPAGRYEITAVSIRPEARGPGGGTIEDLVFGPRGSLDAATRVVTLALAAGDETHDVDFIVPGTAETCPMGPSRRPPDGVVAPSIAGRVLAATGEPLVCAIVRIVTQGVNIPQVYTDRQGRYSIEGLTAGSLLVQASRSGYTTLQYGQQHPSDAEAPITLRDDEQRARVDIVLPRESLVSGTVVDERGEPVEGIPVWAFELRRVDGGTFAMSSVSTRPTDDRGQYRLIGVRPGTYVVVAMARGVLSGAAAQARSYGSIYYPGTPDASLAQPIALDVGRDAHGVDIAMTTSFMADVSGSVVDAAGRPVFGTVTMSTSGRSGAVSVESWSATTDSNGAFVVRNVPRGDYVVKASAAPSDPSRFGMQYVTIVDTDPPLVRIVVAEGATLEGRLVLETQPGANLAGLTLSAAPADFDYTPPPAGSQLRMFPRQDDGTFRIAGVTGPSRLLIGSTPACEGCYLKSAYVNGMDAADTPFDFGLKGGVYRDVEIVVSDAGAAVEGRVTDERDARVVSYTVVVIPAYPELRHSRSRHLKVGRSSPDGSFRVAGLPPGDYFVIAVNRFDSILYGGEMSDPDVLEQLAARAQRVTLTESERRTLALRLIRR